jgi:hypothetical protein
VCSGYAGSALDSIKGKITNMGYDVKELPVTFDYLQLSQ